MLINAYGCRLMLIDADWCRFIMIGVDWCGDGKDVTNSTDGYQNQKLEHQMRILQHFASAII